VASKALDRAPAREQLSPFGVGARLWIVTGKGGTGRTSVAAALALRAARAGERVLVASGAADGALPALLGLDAPDAARNHPVEIEPRLHALLLSPQDSLARYLDLQLPIAGMGKRLLASRAFAAFLEAAPGWRELVSLAALWQLEQERVLVNRREPEPGFALEELRPALADLPRRGAPALVRPRALAAALAFQQRRFAQQRHWVAELERELAPVRSLPELDEPLEGLRGVARLAEELASEARSEAQPSEGGWPQAALGPGPTGRA
jgi:hypothetical protein